MTFSRIHAGKPGILLEPRRAERRDTDIADRAHDTIGKERRAREYMRSPARPSVEAEAIEAELVCKRAYVGDLVDHATAMVPI